MSMTKINTKYIAEQLSGIEYTATINMRGSELMRAAKFAGIAIVYGMSDDLMEFEGAIHEELGAPGVAYLTSNGLLMNDCTDNDCPYYEKAKEGAATIEALWCKESDFSWTFNTDIPHETFLIMEDGETYCRGIVFALTDVGKKTDPKPESKPATITYPRGSLGEQVDSEGGEL